MNSRIVCWFSCGAASAVATKLAIAQNAGRLPLVVAYTEVNEEHPDNTRFMSECAAWFGQEIVVLRNEKYQGSIYQTFEQVGFIVGPYGAACTTRLKKDVRKKFELAHDLQVFGFTSEESERAYDFQESNPTVTLLTPLIEQGVSKADCLAVLEKQGIEIPMMYKLGYKNNNCIGCVKGGAGYWNKIRVDFPDVFERMADLTERMGVTIVKYQTGGVRRRVSLRELPPDAGNYQTEPSIECGIACEIVSGVFKERTI